MSNIYMRTDISQLQVGDRVLYRGLKKPFEVIGHCRLGSEGKKFVATLRHTLTNKIDIVTSASWEFNRMIETMEDVIR